MFNTVELVVEPKVRELCTEPYHAHPRGCPNYGKRDSCPPNAPLISETLDLSKPAFVVWNMFPLLPHVHRMQARHPEWSERQLYCCLYWQPTARKELREMIREFLVVRPGMTIVMVPEAQGVDVTATMLYVGMILEWPPKKNAYQVAVAGHGVRQEVPE